jgi:hypothetical protein
MRLAERYLCTGDLWAFLKEVDSDYRFQLKEMNSIVAREVGA